MSALDLSEMPSAVARRDSVPKARRKTRPTLAAKERRLTAKRHRSERKRTRRPADD